MAYKQGELLRISGAFTTAAGVATDPTVVKVSVVRPDGQRQSYTYGTDSVVVKDSTGNYHIDVDGSVPGTWTYRWFSTGTGQAADDKTLIVLATLATDAPGEPESLGIDYSQLQRAVGRMLGVGRNGQWQPNERADVHDIIRSGLRRFYWPPPLPLPEAAQGQVVHLSASSLAERQTWSWSFLRANTTLDISSGTSTYNLPDDFGELLDTGFTFSTDQGGVAMVGEDAIRSLQSEAARSGPPQYAAVRVKTGGDRTRYEVLFYPTPDVAYTLNYRYSITPNDLSESRPIPWGGPQHAETILEAVLAAAEKTLNDEEGLHEKKFLECLTRSIQADKNLTKIDTDVWPLEDKAKGLGITKAYLKRLIGRLLGLGPHQALWNHNQASEVDLALQTGLRKFYAPCVLPGDKYSHEWSFLCPLGHVVTNDVVSEYDLPTGFVDIDGPLTFAPDERVIFPPIDLVPEYRIRQLFQRTTAAGRPTMGSVRMKPINPAGGTLYELILWPQPDDAYQLSFRYQVNPAAMENDACLPYGGQQHAQTIIEACLAAAEELGGMAAGPVVNGPHAAKFLECLIASVSLDRRTGSPETVGYNRDRSDRVGEGGEGFANWHDCDANLVTYNGLLY